MIGPCAGAPLLDIIPAKVRVRPPEARCLISIHDPYRIRLGAKVPAGRGET